MPKSKTVPDWYAEHGLFCSAVTKHMFVAKAKKTPENPTPQSMSLLQNDETSSKNSRH